MFPFQPRPTQWAGLPKPAASDTHSQLEELLSAVWEAEAEWAWDDRNDLRCGAGPVTRCVSQEVFSDRHGAHWSWATR